MTERSGAAKPTRRQFLAAAIPIATWSRALLPPAAEVEREFANPRNESRLRMHWYIFGPAWTAEEGKRQLELMQKAGIGGVLIFPTYPVVVDQPARGWKNQPYLSTEFLEVLSALTVEARTLGLTADLVVGTGWPFGGPSVSLDDAAHAIRRLRLPVRRGDTSRLPAWNAGEKLVAAFYLDGDNVTEISKEVAGGVLSLSPNSSGEIQIFYSAPTRMEVKRASAGADGLVLDHYNPEALGRYLDAVAAKLVDGVPLGSLRSLFCDSLEVYRSNWTANFPEIFRRMRGYDLIPRLPALFDDSHPDSRDLRCDFWRTLSEQAVEGFVKPLREWTAGHGLLLQMESYGAPPVSLASYRHVDIPVGEHYEWKEFNSSRWASSGARLAGRRLVAAEAWTWLGLPNRFADSMEQLKLASDLHFLSGINSLLGITYAYSPVELGAPGWVPYFGPVVNHTAPYWPHFPLLANYVHRASYILQQGKPVADVALYLGAEDAMAAAGVEQLMLNWATRDRMSSNGIPPEFSLKNALHYESDLVKTIITNGYSFDGVDTFAFNGGLQVENGRLQMGDGYYSILVLPNLISIDVASLEKIAVFARQGGAVIATRRLPETVYGMRNREESRRRARQLVAEIFNQGRGVLATDERASLLAALRKRQPDISFAEASEHVSFVHRRTADRDFYFLANTSDREQQLLATFRAGRRPPEEWDLHTGKIVPLGVFEYTSEGTRLLLRLPPFGSRLIVFSDSDRGPLAWRTNLPEIRADGTATVEQNGQYFLEAPGGRRTVSVSGIPAPSVLSPTWRLRLGQTRVGLAELESWTEIPDARFFSGRGIYEADFELPALVLEPSLGVWLDLGRVHETAEVLVNGQAAGVAWMRPYKLDITRLLRAGKNRLRVEVTNLLINKVIGGGPIDYSQVFARYGRRFPPGEEWERVREPFVSGLLGPVRLVFNKQVSLQGDR